jgi:hypothetical protein
LLVELESFVSAEPASGGCRFKEEPQHRRSP